MTEKLDHYKNELVKIYLDGEDAIGEQSIRIYVDSLNPIAIFEQLGISPDHAAIEQFEAHRELERAKMEKEQVRNQCYERLSKLKGSDRIEAILELEKGGNTGSVLPTTPMARLDAGDLLGVNRIAAILNVKNSAC